MDARTKACWIELFPFCPDMSKAVMRSTSTTASSGVKQPTQMVCSIVWADYGLDAADAKSLICDSITNQQKACLEQLVTEKTYFVDDFDAGEFKPSQNETAPTYNPQDFAATFPTAHGRLALRQQWLDLQKSKFTAATWKSFEGLVAQHNEDFNPDGHNFSEGNPNKRTGEGLSPRAEGEELPEYEGQPTSKDEWVKKFCEGNANAALTPTHKGQELLFDNKGGLRVHGPTDDIITASEPLCCICFVISKLAKKQRSFWRSLPKVQRFGRGRCRAQRFWCQRSAPRSRRKASSHGRANSSRSASSFATCTAWAWRNHRSSATKLFSRSLRTPLAMSLAPPLRSSPRKPASTLCCLLPKNSRRTRKMQDRGYFWATLGHGTCRRASTAMAC